MMNVILSIPTAILVNQTMAKVNADGAHGNFCVLPRHTDYLAPLVPGILILTDFSGSEFYFANDHGLLVKCGENVHISARRAIKGESLQTLHRTVRDRFMRLDQTDRDCQTAVASLEASFLRRFLDMQKELS